jgi:hypothetical protein
MQRAEAVHGRRKHDIDRVVAEGLIPESERKGGQIDANFKEQSSIEKGQPPRRHAHPESFILAAVGCRTRQPALHQQRRSRASARLVWRGSARALPSG